MFKFAQQMLIKPIVDELLLGRLNCLVGVRA